MGIAEETSAILPDLLLCDYADLTCVHDVAQEIRGSYGAVDVLINNAGLITSDHLKTVDGHDLTFQVNHLAPFLLTNLLLDRLEAASSARVVTVSSGAHEFMRGGMDFEDIELDEGWSPFRAYANSKLANILFAYELCARMGGTRVTSNAVHPGAVRSGFGRTLRGVSAAAIRLAQPFLRSPERGAQTLLYLATASEVEGISGGYFHDMRPTESSKASLDSDSARQLWEISAAMVGIS
jgi:NAD(P)-dependent dehydrogenase (short-subunit alcohol dehydrogenase family)